MSDVDKLLIINQVHRRRVMREYVAFSNTARPHQNPAQQPPIPITDDQDDGPGRCYKVLGGIIYGYYCGAA